MGYFTLLKPSTAWVSRNPSAPWVNILFASVVNRLGRLPHGVFHTVEAVNRMGVTKSVNPWVNILFASVVNRLGRLPHGVFHTVEAVNRMGVTKSVSP